MNINHRRSDLTIPNNSQTIRMSEPTDLAPLSRSTLYVRVGPMTVPRYSGRTAWPKQSVEGSPWRARSFPGNRLALQGMSGDPFLGLTGHGDQCLQVVETEREVEPRIS